MIFSVEAEAPPGFQSHVRPCSGKLERSGPQRSAKVRESESEVGIHRGAHQCDFCPELTWESRERVFSSSGHMLPGKF